MKGMMKIFVVVRLTLLLVVHVTPASAGWGNETINYSPKSFVYKVDEKGNITGPQISVAISRTEPPRGVTQRCMQVMHVSVSTQKGYGTPEQKVGELILDPPKCSFSRTITGLPFRESDIRDRCFMMSPTGRRQGTMPVIEHRFRNGTSHDIETTMYVGFTAAKAFGEALMLNRPVKSYEFRLGAHVECVASANFQAQPVGPTVDSQGRGALASTGTMCDLSGMWQQRNTRTNEVHPLVWKIERLANEGAQDRRNYEVTRYKDGRRFSPPASGRLYQSSREAFIVYDTPASMPRYNVSRIMSLRKLAVQPGCNAMKVLKVLDTWKGSRGASSLVMERLQAGSLRPTGSVVGRPVVKGQQPVWQGDKRPVLPDNRLQEIERRERQRGR